MNKRKPEIRATDIDPKLKVKVLKLADQSKRTVSKQVEFMLEGWIEQNKTK